MCRRCFISGEQGLNDVSNVKGPLRSFLLFHIPCRNICKRVFSHSRWKYLRSMENFVQKGKPITVETHFGCYLLRDYPVRSLLNPPFSNTLQVPISNRSRRRQLSTNPAPPRITREKSLLIQHNSQIYREVTYYNKKMVWYFRKSSTWDTTYTPILEKRP